MSNKKFEYTHIMIGVNLQYNSNLWRRFQELLDDGWSVYDKSIMEAGVHYIMRKERIST